MLNGTSACDICRRSSTRHAAFASQRCAGSAVAKWAARENDAATSAAHHTSSHARYLTGNVVWCNRGGAYGDSRSVGLAKPCRGPPPRAGEWGRHTTLRRLRNFLHPKTATPLPRPHFPEPSMLVPAAIRRSLTSVMGSGRDDGQWGQRGLRQRPALAAPPRATGAHSEDTFMPSVTSEGTDVAAVVVVDGDGAGDTRGADGDMLMDAADADQGEEFVDSRAGARSDYRNGMDSAPRNSGHATPGALHDADETLEGMHEEADVTMAVERDVCGAVGGCGALAQDADDKPRGRKRGAGDIADPRCREYRPKKWVPRHAGSSTDGVGALVPAVAATDMGRPCILGGSDGGEEASEGSSRRAPSARNECIGRHGVGAGRKRSGGLAPHVDLLDTRRRRAPFGESAAVPHPLDGASRQDHGCDLVGEAREAAQHRGEGVHARGHAEPSGRDGRDLTADATEARPPGPHRWLQRSLDDHADRVAKRAILGGGSNATSAAERMAALRRRVAARSNSGSGTVLMDANASSGAYGPGIGRQ